MLSDKYSRVPCGAIVVNREERQRKEIEVGDLEGSIRRNGVLQPIIVTESLQLLAGERRLTASIKCGLPDIPVRFAPDGITPEQLQVIELEENVKRKDLPWRDHVKAIGTLHDNYTKANPNWTQTQTAMELAEEIPFISKALRVYRDLDSPRIASSTGMIAAYNVLSRMDDRAGADALAEILDAVSIGVDIGEERSVARGAVEAVEPRPAPTTPGLMLPNGKASVGLGASPTAFPESIIQGDFISWSGSYTGPKFNLVHCDFPYGVNVFKGDQAGKANWQEEGRRGDVYNDDPNVYWELCRAFARNLDHFMAQSAHLIFWFSMDFYSETLDFFAQHAGELVFNPKPLVWVKSDNMGILPDPKRGPRQIYETALFASRGDRMIIRAVSNAISAPTDKEYHPSTKPVPVLKHFMGMLVDENTRMLDPTCGSASSLRAAEALGAKEVMGLELDPQFVVSARGALKKDRTLRKLSRQVEGKV